MCFLFQHFSQFLSLTDSLRVLHVVLRRERDAQTRFQRFNEPSGPFRSRLWTLEQLWLQEAIHKNNYRALI